MVKIQVELLTDEGNNAVVRLPSRKFPGVVMQGDSLSVMCTNMSEAMAAMDRAETSTARELIVEIAARLQDAQNTYEAALREHGIKLPY